VLTPLLAAENAAGMWESLDLARKRDIIKTLMSITLLSPGKGAHGRSTRPPCRSPGTSRMARNKQPDGCTERAHRRAGEAHHRGRRAMGTSL
jgi:hypothetical protein